MKMVRRGFALFLALVLLLMPVSSALAVNRLERDNWDQREAVKERSQVEYMRTYNQGAHQPGAAWTVLHYDSDYNEYYSILCFNPLKDVPGALYEVLLTPASTGVPPLSWYNYQRPAMPAPPGPGYADDSPRDNGSFYYSHALGGWGGAERMGFPKTCAVLDHGTGQSTAFVPAVVGLPTAETDPEMSHSDEDRLLRQAALAAYPPIPLNVGGVWDAMPAHRQMAHAVVHYPVDYKVSLKASTTAITPGVPFDLYLRVEHNSKQPYCPVPIGIALPESWAVKDGQGADQEARGIRQGQPWQGLWWTVQLKPGQAAERWVTVVPGEPDEFTSLVKQGVDLVGGLSISSAQPKPGSTM